MQPAEVAAAIEAMEPLLLSPGGEGTGAPGGDVLAAVLGIDPAADRDERPRRRRRGRRGGRRRTGTSGHEQETSAGGTDSAGVPEPADQRQPSGSVAHTPVPEAASERRAEEGQQMGIFELIEGDRNSNA
jgi:hypothetical protein